MTEQGPPPAGRPPTIYDVARECGVASSTVSRAFSRPGRVSASTAERIRAAAERIGYRADPIARALPTGRTSMIAVVVSDFTNPVYFPIVRGAEQAADEAGLTIVLRDTMESGPAERVGIYRVLAMVEGVVLASSRMSDAAIRAIAARIPLVLLNRVVPGVAGVVTDNSAGMRLAVEHLGSLGHESITYLAGPEASWADGVRWRAVYEAAQGFGLRARRIGPCLPTIIGGVNAVDELLRHPSPAVIAYNDLLAIGVLRGLAAAGVGVPAQTSIIGCDNIFGSDFCSPPLTTVAAPLRDLGLSAVRQLIAQIGGAKPSLSPPRVLPVHLVLRGSTAAPNRHPQAH